MKKIRIVVVLAAALLIAGLIIGKHTIQTSHDAEKKSIDLIVFMGQSNMSGRGDYTQAPVLAKGAGFEFRAVTDPTKLYPITEPFGVNEDNENGLYEPGAKTGSMVTAFVNSYYEKTNVPIVGVAATKGASGITEWIPGTDYYSDSLNRYKTARDWLNGNGYHIRHSYMVWLQGEYDAAIKMEPLEYTEKLKSIVDGFQEEGIEQCMLIRIGEIGDIGDGDVMYENDQAADVIIAAQTELCKNDEDFVMISTLAAGLPEQGMMQADFTHWNQAGYNYVGADAGANMAEYVLTGKEPILHDPEYGNEYACNEK